MTNAPDPGPAQIPLSAVPGAMAYTEDVPDRRDGRVYVLSADVEIAVKVAIATGRPLLVRGEPGSGKSSLAAHLARIWDWRYYEYVVTSRSQARDLLWTFDHVRRLADAEVRRDGRRPDDRNYVEPGVLWWAFARDSALRRGAAQGDSVEPAVEPDHALNADRADHGGAIVLIDEIDKADPDLPNGLLVPLGSNEFVVTETRTVVRKLPPSQGGGIHLFVITTNEERELPQAFLRRCVVTWLEAPDRDRLVSIAERHLVEYEGAFSEADKRLARELAKEVCTLRDNAKVQAVRPPSTAEFLDALRACRSFGVGPNSPDKDRKKLWEDVRKFTLEKNRREGE